MNLIEQKSTWKKFTPFLKWVYRFGRLYIVRFLIFTIKKVTYQKCKLCRSNTARRNSWICARHSGKVNWSGISSSQIPNCLISRLLIVRQGKIITYQTLRLMKIILLFETQKKKRTRTIAMFSFILFSWSNNWLYLISKKKEMWKLNFCIL